MFLIIHVRTQSYHLNFVLHVLGCTYVHVHLAEVFVVTVTELAVL